MTESFDFSAGFQDCIIACLIRHPDKFLRFGPILKPNFFLGVQATIAAKVAIDYANERHRFPSWEALEQMALDEAQTRLGNDEETRERITGYLQRLRELDTGDVEFVSQHVVNFARERATLGAIKANIADVQAGKIGREFITRLEEALRVGQNIDDLGYLLHRDAEDAIRKITSTHYGIRTGFPLLDNVWRNGLAPGWLVILLAPPKRYKTAMCLNLAINMISPSIGENVFYYTCEISQELALARCLFNISGQTQDYMYENPEKFITIAKQEIGRTVAGNLLIKGFASGEAKISDIEAHAQTAINQTGIIPKAIFIDYAETVASSDRDMSEHRQSASVYTEARAMGHRLGCPVIMPDRCNRETVSHAVPSMTSFQGAFQKAGIVDAAIGLCATEAEYVNNIIRAFIFENRHGRAYQHFRGTVDPDVMQLEFNEEIEYNPEDEVGKKLKTKKKKRDDVADAALPDELKE